VICIPSTYVRLKVISEIWTALKVVVTAGSEGISYFLFGLFKAFVLN